VALDFSRYEGIDWDADDDPNGNLVHCLQEDHLGPEPERLVDEVLSREPVEFKMPLHTAEYAIVGPERYSDTLWVVLLDTSHKRGDWLRPVTGWPGRANRRLGRRDDEAEGRLRDGWGVHERA